MPNARKFLFDTSFDVAVAALDYAAAPEAPVMDIVPPAPAEEAVPSSLQESPVGGEELEVIRQAAYHDGFEAGRAEVLAGLEQKEAELLHRISEQLGFIEESSQDGVAQFTGDAVRVSQRLIRALSPQLAAMGKDREIGALLEQCFGHLRGEARLVIRGAEEDQEMLSKLAASIARRADYRGSLTVEADPALAGGDCVVLWEQGRAERLQSAIHQQIDRLIAAVAP